MKPNSNSAIKELASQDYKYGFVSDIEAETIAKGLSEDVIRLISAKKGEPEFLLEWRLSAYRAWLKMKEPKWQNVNYPQIDFQDVIYIRRRNPRLKKPRARLRAWTKWIPSFARC